MSNRLLRTLPVVLVVSLTAAALTAEFTLNWFTIDGGGDTVCTGGGYELSGTAGQPDASDGALTGGGYELTGGFWKPIPRGCPPKEPDEVDSEPVDEPVEPINSGPLPPP